LGPDHPAVAETLDNLAQILRSQGRVAEAEPLARRALSIAVKALGAKHPDFLPMLENLTAICRDLNKEDEARQLEQRLAAIRAGNER